ncbi:Hypothetical protein P9515_14031 [Prochlorococcus marinus str. MIT 9515]|uniref:Glycosyltransferase 2-like domain-containing protein n=1 Tax=Prochlorococcus marinus (strain MIT 9515) TaxID=167542 RepID=A2BXU9_PROM5|nr:glycosyltransferase family 2 protein [Prochlorococcus marinus]ABM72610.1 Hypothetical protein P9515_14031 [Prochlorococcus marinus str. MIT 9515]
MKYSIVIPCFNEEGTIELILERTKNIFIKNKIELILVNNGSTDNTEDIISKIIGNYPHAKYINLEKNLGYGGGILKGLSHCKGEIIGWTHADLQTDPLDCIKAFKEYEKTSKIQNTFIKGNRKNRPISDKFFTFGMSLFETLLLGKLIYDINAQPTIFPKKFFNSWINPPTDFSLDLYSYYLAKKYNYKVKRISVDFLKRISGQSKWNINFISRIRFILRTIKYSFKLKINKVL